MDTFLPPTTKKFYPIVTCVGYTLDSRKILFTSSQKESHIARLDFTSGEPRCDYRIGGRKGWGRKTRPDGTSYSFPIITGDRCTSPAVCSVKKEGKLQRRCARHSGSTYN